jgi:hypothetical protein
MSRTRLLTARTSQHQREWFGVTTNDGHPGPSPDGRCLIIADTTPDLSTKTNQLPKSTQRASANALQNTTGTQGYQQTPMTFQSVAFNNDGTIHSMDGTVLNKAVNGGGGNATPDAQRHNIGIQTRTGELYRHNTATPGPATQSPGYTSAQLIAPDGKVQIGAYRTDAATAETLKVMAPDLFIEPAAKQAEAQAQADTAKAEEVSREELNRHPGEIEGYHQHIVGEVSQQALIGLMVYGQRGETPPESLLKTIADQMGEPLGSAIDKINLVNQGVQAQFTILARSMNLDADKAADWIKEHRRDTAMSVAQAHYLRRDLQAWTPLLEDYRRATGDGVKRG